MHDFDALDYYELLGVSRSASPEDIKRAYRREISKYHPDRFAGAASEEQRYASARSQRINEANRVLTDFVARSEYNLGRSSTRPTARPAPAPAPPSRDHQAELYDQAQSHLAGGRPLQAMAALRQLQRINPFYRDSADLMVRARSELAAQQNRAGQPHGRRLLALVGVGGAVAAAAVVGWTVTRSPGTPSSVETVSRAGSVPSATIVGVGAAATVAPTAEPTQRSTVAPTDIPTARPTELPSATPTTEPTVVPTETATAAPASTPEPAGELVVGDTFATRSWAQVGGRGWSVGYSGNRYRITADPGYGTIWSYRIGPSGNRSYAVDVRVRGGAAGLMLRFGGEGSYVLVDVDPALGTYHVIRDRGGAEETLAEGSSDAIMRGDESVNRVEAQLRGDTLEVLINNQSLATADLSGTPDNLRYGLVATAGETTAEALFDNLEIRTLK